MRRDEPQKDADGACAARAVRTAKSRFVDAPFSATEPAYERESRDGWRARGDERTALRDSCAKARTVGRALSGGLDVLRTLEALHAKRPPFRGAAVTFPKNLGVGQCFRTGRSMLSCCCKDTATTEIGPAPYAPSHSRRAM